MSNRMIAIWAFSGATLNGLSSIQASIDGYKAFAGVLAIVCALVVGCGVSAVMEKKEAGK